MSIHGMQLPVAWSLVASLCLAVGSQCHAAVPAHTLEQFSLHVDCATPSQPVQTATVKAGDRQESLAATTLRPWIAASAAEEPLQGTVHLEKADSIPQFQRRVSTASLLDQNVRLQI